MERLFNIPHVIAKILRLLPYGDVISLILTCKSIHGIYLDTIDEGEMIYKYKRDMWMSPKVFKLHYLWTRIYQDINLFPSGVRKFAAISHYPECNFLNMWQKWSLSSFQALIVLWYYPQFLRWLNLAIFKYFSICPQCLRYQTVTLSYHWATRRCSLSARPASSRPRWTAELIIRCCSTTKSFIGWEELNKIGWTNGVPWLFTIKLEKKKISSTSDEVPKPTII